MAEQEGGDRRDDDKDTAQTAGSKIQKRDNRRQRVEEGRARMTLKASFFYSDNGLLASTDPGWIQ